MNPPPTTTIQTPRCFYCGNTGEVTVTNDDLARYRAGALAQVAFPEMTPDLREQLITGTHPACWDAMMGPDPDDEEN